MCRSSSRAIRKTARQRPRLPRIVYTGITAAGAEDALDAACGRYLGDPTTCIRPPKN